MPVKMRCGCAASWGQSPDPGLPTSGKASLSAHRAAPTSKLSKCPRPKFSGRLGHLKPQANNEKEKQRTMKRTLSYDITKEQFDALRSDVRLHDLIHVGRNLNLLTATVAAGNDYL